MTKNAHTLKSSFIIQNTRKGGIYIASQNDQYSVQSVERALRILDKLVEKKGGVALTTFSQEIGLHKSTVHRLITTLMNHGYVEQDTVTGYYKLGLKLVGLSNAVLDTIDVRRTAKPFLTELNDLTNEVVHLVVLNSCDVVYIDKIASDQSITINSSIGKVVPIHCTAVGKVLACQLHKEKVLEILAKKGMARYTKDTITEPAAFLKELEIVSGRGYALDENEHEEGIRCIAAPVKDYTGKIVAAISVVGPYSRITDDRLNVLIELTTQTSQRISARMGFQG